LSRVLRLDLAYEGTAYQGWQVQSDAPTVQGCVAEAARKLLGSDLRLTGASRTDAGVHALRQTASLVTASPLGVRAVQAALNAVLPGDIRVLSVRDAPPGFDARRAATGKRYAYLIDTGGVPSPFTRGFVWHVGRPLDVPRMREALACLRGRHDFSAFRASAGRAHDPTCTVRAVHVLQRRTRVAIVVSADRFVHHMVRNIVGSVVEVGRGARAPGWMAEVLRGHDRRRAGPTAPGHGLTLVRVLYAHVLAGGPSAG
jgi:tRNA pseudouridine38-40 synthase